MKPQTRRKIPEKKTAKHKTVAPKETAEQTPPDSVLLGKYQKEISSAYDAMQAVYSLRLDTPQAWKEWVSTVRHYYDRCKKDAHLFSREPVSQEETLYGWDFWRDIELLHGGDYTQVESAVHFLEADPMFFRSGYFKARLIRCIKLPMLTPKFAKRLQNVVLSLVDRRDDRDFRAYCRLARKVNSPELRDQLTGRLTASDPNIRRRAQWVLEALEKDRMGKPPSPAPVKPSIMGE